MEKCNLCEKPIPKNNYHKKYCCGECMLEHQRLYKREKEAERDSVKGELEKGYKFF